MPAVGLAPHQSKERWKKHGPGPGRPRGRQPYYKIAIQEFGHKILESKAYRDALAQRLIRGEAGQMEVLLHQYTYGRPPVNVQLDLTRLSDAEVHQLAAITPKITHS